MELHLKSFPLVPLIEDVAKTIEPMATKNGNRLVIERPANLGTIHADQIRFRQSLLNLASNANKFTEKGHYHYRRSPGTGERPRLDHARRDRYRNRHDARADGQAVPGVFPGFLCHSEQIRWHGPWARHQSALLSNDGR